MSIIASFINWLNTKRLHQIDLFRKYPVETQNDVFFNLINQASGTEWGIKHSYRSIRSISQFQNRFPVQEYDAIIPWIERLRNGETDLLWPGEIKWFAKSSGTTSTKSKFIPMSRESLEDCHFRGGKDVLALYTSQMEETGIFTGKALTLGGSHRINNFSNDSLYGDLSAILIENAPFWVDILREPRASIALLEDFSEKMKKITESTVKMNITNIAGVPSWYLVLIKHILEQTGKNNLLEVWPNLELFIHGGVSFTPYREQYKALIPGDQMKYMETYNASEGFFGIQDDLGSDDMLLMLDYGIFYEFLPSGESHLSGKYLTVGEVEKNVNYVIVISTNGGLWRYMIGDTITFTNLFPHKFRITGRTRHFINVFGEEVIVDNAEKAIGMACVKNSALVNEYTAGPVFMSRDNTGAHEWVVEFEKEPASRDQFTSDLDAALKELNSDYEAKRFNDLTLTMPVLNVVPRGTFHKWLTVKNKLGGQNKVPRLSNSREYIEELISIGNK